MKDTKYYTKSWQSTNEFVEELKPDETLLIINVGQAQTTLPELREHIVEINVMMHDISEESRKTVSSNKYNGIHSADPLRDFKYDIIQFVFENWVDKFDHVIVRCDAGASRSQAISTALSRKYGIKFDTNIRVGELDILKSFSKYIGGSTTEEEYNKLFADMRAEDEIKFAKYAAWHGKAKDEKENNDTSD